MHRTGTAREEEWAAKQRGREGEGGREGERETYTRLENAQQSETFELVMKKGALCSLYVCDSVCERERERKRQRKREREGCLRVR